MNNTEALNKKLTEWAGFKLDFSLGHSGTAIDPGGNHIRGMPNFTQSLDACFKWLVPRASEDNYEVALSTEGKNYYAELFGVGQGDHLQAKAETPALAVCLAIEELIDAKEQE